MLLSPAVFRFRHEITHVFYGCCARYPSLSDACHEIIMYQVSPILIKISSVLITDSDKTTIFLFAHGNHNLDIDYITHVYLICINITYIVL